MWLRFGDHLVLLALMQAGPLYIGGDTPELCHKPGDVSFAIKHFVAATTNRTIYPDRVRPQLGQHLSVGRQLKRDSNLMIGAGEASLHGFVLFHGCFLCQQSERPGVPKGGVDSRSAPCRPISIRSIPSAAVYSNKSGKPMAGSLDMNDLAHALQSMAPSLTDISRL